MKFLILFFFLVSTDVFAWGELGHRLVVEYASPYYKEKALQNCNITPIELLSHTNDPDRLWRKNRKYPKEEFAHYFHLDSQMKGWEGNLKPNALTDGFLLARIVEWHKKAKELVKEGKTEELKMYLYGLSHYIGDLTQPLHLHHDHNGVEHKLEDLHSQFETKMLSRFEPDLRKRVKDKASVQPLTAIWEKQTYQELIISIAKQTSARSTQLFDEAKYAVTDVSSKKSRKSKQPKKKTAIRFDKKKLWEKTGEIASDQIALSSKLWSYTINEICDPKEVESH